MLTFFFFVATQYHTWLIVLYICIGCEAKTVQNSYLKAANVKSALEIIKSFEDRREENKVLVSF